MKSKALIDRLKALESATIADVMTALGLHGQVLSPALRACSSETVRCAGHAICARGSNTPDGPGIPSFKLDDAITQGGIVLIDTDGCDTGAIVGGNMVASMLRLGAVGFIIDGGIRDVQELASCGAPVYRRYDTPISAHGRWKYTSVGKAITLPGIWEPVQIHPGDLVLADGDGITVLPQAHAEQIINYAEQHIQTEDAIGNAIRNGESRETATNDNPRLTYVIPLTDLAAVPNE